MAVARIDDDDPSPLPVIVPQQSISPIERSVAGIIELFHPDEVLVRLQVAMGGLARGLFLIGIGAGSVIIDVKEGNPQPVILVVATVSAVTGIGVLLMSSHEYQEVQELLSDKSEDTENI